jgi:hypothetical protein
MTAPDPEVQKISPDREFSVCPQCGYTNGFHSVFLPGPKTNHLKWLLVCPSCSAVYDLGLKAPLESPPTD